MVPGYVRCPKCHTPLPKATVGPTAFHSGGTAVDSRRFPVGAVVIAVVALVAVIGGYFLFRKHGTSAAAQPDETAAATTPSSDDTDTSAPPSTFAPAPPAHPEDVAAELERTLKRMHLWATVEVGTGLVDVRSGSCSDPAIRPVLDAAAPRFKKAGLTRLRCLEESGSVVFSREL